MTAIRTARPTDAEALARIYNEGVAERTATFETQPRGAADFADRIALAHTWPLVVAEHDGRVVGWAAISEYNPRECYRGVGEATLYVERAARRHGVGSQLMDELAAAAERAGYWKLIGRLFTDNEPSRALLRNCGFSDVGVHHRHGRLDGEWRDVLVVERLLGEAAEADGPS